MKVEYQRELQHNYLILREERDTLENLNDERTDYRISMLMNLRGREWLPVTVHYRDAQPVFYYEISSRQSLERIIQKTPMDYKKLKGLFRDIGRALQKLESYLLSDTGILLEPEYIYVNMDTESFQFCYYIGHNQAVKESMHKLLEYLLNYIDYQDKDGVAAAYEWYRASAQENFCIEEISKTQIRKPQEILMEEREAVEETQNLEYMPEWKEEIQESKQGSSLHILQKIFGKKEQVQEEEHAIGAAVCMEETKAYAGDRSSCVTQGETMYLFQEMGKSTKRLLCKNTGNEPDFVLQKLPFLIGKAEGMVDGVLHTASVSRIHAQIEFDDEAYYVRDLNSTNGTFLNGQLLEMNELVKLEQGDSIRFADVEYEFL